jgi:amidohydrolase
VEHGTVRTIYEKWQDRVAGIRHAIHARPELGNEEFETAGLIRSVLGELGIETGAPVAGTGVLGLIRGHRPGRTVLLRADMDALPIQEEVDLPYRSRIPERMHACGHDGHVAGVLGAAMILAELRDRFAGQVKLAFQPAEETTGGAEAMIREGILDDPRVDVALGCHLWGSLAEGRVQVLPGPLMASVDAFRFRIRGTGGHGAMPHLAVDPIVAAAHAVTALQTIVSRRIDPLEPAVLTLASIHGGQAENVIPEWVEVTGTVRAFQDPLREAIARDMETILAGVAAAHGATCEFTYTPGFPPLENDPAVARRMADSFAKVVGADRVETTGRPVMGSEDFAYFSRAVPSAYAFVGIAKDPRRPVLHHSATFQWDDANLAVLAQGLAMAALDALEASD